MSCAQWLWQWTQRPHYAFILFTSLHKKRWRSGILVFLLMTSYSWGYKEREHTPNFRKVLFLRGDGTWQRNDWNILQTSPRDFVGWTYLRRYYEPGRITVSVYYTQTRDFEMLDNIFCEIQAQLLERFGNSRAKSFCFSIKIKVEGFLLCCYLFYCISAFYYKCLSWFSDDSV